MTSVEDISLRCNMCKSYYALSSCMDHRKRHRAMRILRYKEGKGPKNIPSLSKRHMVITQKVLLKFKECPSDPNLARRIEKINDAFEVLRSEMTKDDATLKAMLLQDGMTSMRDGYFESRDKVEDNDVCADSVWVSAEAGYPPCVTGIGYCQAMNKEWRDRMEDRLTIRPFETNFNNEESSNGACYLGLFDGYQGSVAAESCAENMHRVIAEEITNEISSCEKQSGDGDANGKLSTFQFTEETERDKVSLSDKQVSKCLARSYVKMDEHLGYGINETSRTRWSGCSAVTVLIVDNERTKQRETGSNTKGSGDGNGSVMKSGSDGSSVKNTAFGKMFISNSGDAQAVLYHKKKPHKMSEIHSLENEKERDRVVAAGGHISQSERHARVNGLLHVTRGLGNHGDQKNKKCVIATPHVSVARLNKDSQMVVIASNSVWSVLNPSDVYSVLMHSIPSATGVRPGPTPIIPVVHGHFRGGRKGASADGSDVLPATLSSTLPSIVETEEEEAIEEVIFVEAQDSDSDDDNVKEPASDLDPTSASLSSANEHESDPAGAAKAGKGQKKSLEGQAGSEESFSSKTGTAESVQRDSKYTEKQLLNEMRSRTARDMSENIVRAALHAGAVENLSVIVVLLEGFNVFGY